MTAAIVLVGTTSKPELASTTRRPSKSRIGSPGTSRCPATSVPCVDLSGPGGDVRRGGAHAVHARARAKGIGARGSGSRQVPHSSQAPFRARGHRAPARDGGVVDREVGVGPAADGPLPCARERHRPRDRAVLVELEGRHRRRAATPRVPLISLH
eukprot:1223762-Prymnesium_polylepis.1